VPLIVYQPENTTLLKVKTASVYEERVARIKYAWSPYGNVTWAKQHPSKRGSKSNKDYEVVEDGKTFGISTTLLEVFWLIFVFIHG